VPVSSVAALFGDLRARWWLSGGVALDLWLGHTTRPHGDIDVSVLRADWQALARALPPTLEAHAALGGEIFPLPGGPTFDSIRNIWVADTRLRRWVLQVNLEEGDQSHWRYRRHAAIHRRWPDAVIRRQGVPIVNPAVQLLWKARDPVAKDEADFAAVEPFLAADDRLWLAGAVAAAHPLSPWLGRLQPHAR
jgi:hypothetical protein